MKVKKHTQGPWISVNNNEQDKVRSSRLIMQDRRHDAANIAMVIPHAGILDEQVEANGKLIAAAPDMLEALRPLCDAGFLEALRHDITSLSEAQENAIIAAYKKATE